MSNNEADPLSDPLLAAIKSADEKTKSAIRAYLNEEQSRNLPRSNLSDESKKGSDSSMMAASALGLTAVTAAAVPSSSVSDADTELREAIDISLDTAEAEAETDSILAELQSLNISVDSAGDTLIIVDLKPSEARPSNAETLVDWLTVIVNSMIALTLLAKLRRKIVSRADTRYSQLGTHDGEKVASVTRHSDFISYEKDFMEAAAAALAAIQSALSAGES
jgi:hypothetical protein